ncbi:hypothetical protein ACFQER_06590 [Halomicroarcula sp. GCM10025894]
MSTEQAVLGSFSAADGTRAWQFRSGTSSSTPQSVTAVSTSVTTA